MKAYLILANTIISIGWLVGYIHNSLQTETGNNYK
jgi:hypothetical protein